MIATKIKARRDELMRLIVEQQAEIEVRRAEAERLLVEQLSAEAEEQCKAFDRYVADQQASIDRQVTKIQHEVEVKMAEKRAEIDRYVIAKRDRRL